jgi:hypothetical protein
VDWKAAFDSLVSKITKQEHYANFKESSLVECSIQEATTTRPGSRRFVTKWKKSEESENPLRFLVPIPISTILWPPRASFWRAFEYKQPE